MQSDKPILILLVDDEPPVIDILSRVGQQLFPEAQFVSVESPQETLELLADESRQQPQLILLDIDLHQSVDGIELIPKISSITKKHVPIVMFSSSVSDSNVQRSYKAGAVAYTQKPEDMEGWRNYVAILKRFWYETSRLPRKSED
ncbi:response regulator [Spirosoma sp. BT702]|uniref:Response regulator n=1 Tax=Spirosoma profusum TaxID=2771354 RepID=A0A926Y3B5_9BACT|nr:response regulator [Spirosoma profusum]MBD2703892.1 response regulator [Spirosoma profusum]